MVDKEVFDSQLKPRLAFYS